MLSTPSHDLVSCLDRIDRLGVFPDAAQRVLQVAQRPDADLTDLEEAVCADPVLSARVLQVANSALYAPKSTVGTVRRAVQLLGLDATRAMAFALAVSALGSDGGPLARSLHEHALLTSEVVVRLSPHVASVHSGLLFLTALVHDLGLQLLLLLEPDATTQLVDKLGHGTTLVRAERLHFGFDHAQLGAEGLLRWGLPEPAAELVRTHHDPVMDRKQRARALLQVADHMAEGAQAGEMPWQVAERGRWHPLSELLHIDDGVWEKLGEEATQV
ncbi:MAG: HDOD domain-containing protein [Myxococcales bacterium]|nr:HDOD domain-containing protein [Myxococcales bacterium]